MVAKLLQAGLVIASRHSLSRWQDHLSPIIRVQRNYSWKCGCSTQQSYIRLHVHVWNEDRETGMTIISTVFSSTYLSTNSPFWEGRNTGFKSFRTKVFDKFPRTGIPDEFYSATQYDDYIKLLIKTKCIDNAKKVWWDIRLHPFFNTIEFRICDIPMRIEETITLAAIMQAIIAKLYWLMQYNLSFRTYSRALINENKWRAARYGIENKLIDFGKEKEVETTQLIEELVEFIDDLVDDLGSRKEVNHAT